jgi:hypothetical protein
MMQSNKTTTQKDTFTMQAVTPAELEGVEGGGFWDVVAGVAILTNPLGLAAVTTGVVLAATSSKAY